MYPQSVPQQNPKQDLWQKRPEHVGVYYTAWFPPALQELWELPFHRKAIIPVSFASHSESVQHPLREPKSAADLAGTPVLHRHSHHTFDF